MKTLFIDTHSECVRIIFKDGETIIREDATSHRSHSEVTIPTLEKVLQRGYCKIEDIDELIVVNGPGSFTGVRMGVTVAKTIAHCKNIPIKTITSLEMYGVSSDKHFDIVTVEDSKGVYSALCKDGEYGEFLYQRRSDFEEYVLKNGFEVLDEKQIDIEKIVDYTTHLDAVNPHVVNPIYIKEIDALK